MEGTRISHYAVVRLLGRGGMGEVYEAEDLDLGRHVALKFIAPEFAADAESMARFEQEAANAARLSHPHIARVFAFHRDTRPPFIDMELMPGGSLRRRMAGGPLAVHEALAFARDVAHALAHAHRKNIVHRDIKPENLMFGEEGEIKVMDFGLARALHAARLTMTGSTVGTAAYMSPESVRGVVGAPSDVFALGVTLHEMLAGALPFAGDSPLALMYSIANTGAPAVRGLRPEVCEAAEELLLRLLDKDAARRPDAAAAARELAALTGVAPARESARAATDASATAAADANSGVVEASVTRLPAIGTPGAAVVPVARGALVRQRGASRVRWALAGVLALAAAATAITMAVRRQGTAAAAEARRWNDEGVVLLARGEYETAAPYFERALARDRGMALAMINLGRVWHQRRQESRADSLFAAALRAAPHDATTQAYAWSARADLEMSAGTWPAAVTDLERAFALDSSEARAYNQLGFALVQAGRAGEAGDLLGRGIARFPGIAALRKNAAIAALGLGQPARARAQCDTALAVDPGFGEAWLTRARAAAALGEPAAARHDFAAGLADTSLSREAIESAARELAARGIAVPPPR